MLTSVTESLSVEKHSDVDRKSARFSTVERYAGMHTSMNLTKHALTEVARQKANQTAASPTYFCMRLFQTFCPEDRWG